MKRILFIVFMGGYLACNLPVMAQSQEEELARIKERIKQNKHVISQKKQEKKIAERQLGQLSKELKVTELYLNKAKKTLTVTQKKVAITQTQLSQTQQAFLIKKKVFKQRLVDIFKNKNFGMIEFIFSSEDSPYALDASYYFERIMRADTSLMSEIKSQYGDLMTQKQSLKFQTRTLSDIKEKIEEKEDLLQQKKKEQHLVVKSLQEQIKDMERKNRELERSSQEITSQIMLISRGSVFLGTGRFVKPVQAGISSLFGYRRHPIFKRRIFHNGLDFSANTGASIRAADSGVVIVAGAQARYHGYGNITIIDHGIKDGRRLATVYAHQSRILVSEGQRVDRGQHIGLVGATGYATGPHLHFEVRIDGVPVDPRGYLSL